MLKAIYCKIRKIYNMKTINKLYKKICHYNTDITPIILISTPIIQYNINDLLVSTDVSKKDIFTSNGKTLFFICIICDLTSTF